MDEQASWGRSGRSDERRMSSAVDGKGERGESGEAAIHGPSTMWSRAKGVIVVSLVVDILIFQQMQQSAPQWCNRSSSRAQSQLTV